MKKRIRELQKEIETIGDQIHKEKLKCEKSDYDRVRKLQQLVDEKIHEFNALFLNVDFEEIKHKK